MKIKVKNVASAPEHFCHDKCSPVFVKETIISVMEDGCTIMVWRPDTMVMEGTKLLGHDRRITALAVSPVSPLYLCSCSDDKIVIWNIDNLIAKQCMDPPKSSTFGVVGSMEYCCFSWDHSWLALCKEREVWLMRMTVPNGEEDRVDVRLEASLETSAVQGNICAFSPEQHDVLVTVEDSFYFKVWNVQTQTMMYQSPRLGIHTITFCSFSSDPSRLLLATADGTVHVFDMKMQGVSHCAMKASVCKAFATRNSRPETASNHSRSLDVSDLEECGEAGCVIFNVCLYTRDHYCELSSIPQDADDQDEVPGFMWDTTDILKSILAPGPVIVVCSNLGLAVYDCNSWECQAVIIIKEMIPLMSSCPTSMPLFNVMLVGGEYLDHLVCVVKMSVGMKKLHVVSLRTIEGCKRHTARVIPSEHVLPQSPLRLQMNRNDDASEYRGKTMPLRGFKTCKSSGYGRNPRLQMFCPSIHKSKTKGIAATKRQVLKLPGSSDDSNMTKVLLTSGPPTRVKDKVCVWDTSGTAIHLAVSGDGKQLACSSTSSLICVLNFSKLNTDKGMNLVGHDGAINSLHFSLSSHWLLSSSNDCTARVWDWRHKRCILSIDKAVKAGCKPVARAKQVRVASPMVSQAQFYYMDKFILLASGASLELYAQVLHDTSPGTKALESSSACKKVRDISFPTQKVTCFSAANQFHSYMVLCGCSNRTVLGYDLNHEAVVTELQDAHVRPPHQLCQIEGSPALSHAPAMMDLFITSALCDGTKLWDLRSGRCIRKYCEHSSRAYNSGVDVSACGRFLAVCSEDKCVYVYDTRGRSEHISKLTGLGEVVMDVVFNPCRPCLAAAALNGYLASYVAE